jgi:hypothetical protein
LSIASPAPLLEGDSGTSNMIFTVTRSGDLSSSMAVDYATADGTAKAGTDYQAASGTLYFLPNQATQTIAVPVFGNTILQPNRQFTVALTNPRPAPAFLPAATFFTGSAPFAVAVGDLNGDGKPDLAAANTGSGTVAVLLNNSVLGATTPSFAAAQAFQAGFIARSVVEADLNGDGKPDLITANQLANTLSIFLNETPTGATSASFAPQQTIAVSSYPAQVAVGDLNGDGKPDLVVADSGSNQVSVFLNQTPTGATSATFAAEATFPVGLVPGAVAVGDVNADGKLDLVVANQSSNNVSVLLGNGDGTFQAQQTFATGNHPFGVVITDVNGDGKPDLATADFTAMTKSGTSYTYSQASVLLGNGNGTFQAPVNFNTGINPTGIVAQDLNGDGKPDLVVPNFGSDDISVLLNQTATGATVPAFQTQTTYATGTGSLPHSVAAGDINGDQQPDLVTANAGAGTASVFLNASPTTLSAPTITTATATGTIQDDDAPTTITPLSGTTPQTATIATTFSIPLEVQVKNANGNPVQGVTVTFTPPTSGASGTFLGQAADTPFTMVTGPNGLAQAAPFTANLQAGAYTVVATASGNGTTFGSVSFNLTNAAAIAAVLTATSGSGQSAPIGTAFAAPLVVTVTDVFHNPIAGVPVTFTAPSSGPSATLAGNGTGTSDANGQVSLGVTANGVAGSFQITATGAGILVPVTFTLTNTAGSAAALTPVTGNGQSVAVGTALAPLAVLVADQFGNPVSGVTVTFAAPASGASATFGGGATSATAVSNSKGVATAPTLTANHLVGPYTITATAAGASQGASFTVTNTAATRSAFLVTGADAGGGPQVNVYDGKGNLLFAFDAYSPFFLGGVRVAVGDVNGDGIPDIVTAPGPGGGPDIRIWDVTASGATMIGEFNAYSPFFIGGQFVAAGDINGDGKAEIIIGPDQGGGPDVRVFDGSGNLLREFLAYGPFFVGGVRVAAGDINGDGKADIITGAGPSGSPNITVFSGADNAVLQNFLAFGPFFTGGVYVAAGDVNGDGKADIIAGAGPTGGPNVQTFNGANVSQVLDSFFAYPQSFSGGVRVAAADVNGDGKADIITGAGPSGGPQVLVFDAMSLQPLDSFYAYSQAFTGGVYVGGG